MKIAREMFNELGFMVHNQKDSFLLYKFETDYDVYYVHFDKNQKTYNVSYERFIDKAEMTFIPMEKRPKNTKHSAYYGHWQRESITTVWIELHQAIHQQLLEFGWL